jgi:general secretion pathway protein J
MKQDRESGFTLIEIVVSLAILTLLLSLTPAAVRVGRQAWQAEAQLERSAAIASAENTIRRAIAGAIPIKHSAERGGGGIQFEGVGDRIDFVAPAPSSLDSGGLLIHRIATQPRNGGPGQDLILRTTPFANATDAATAMTVLVEDIEAFQVRYFGHTAVGGDRAWSDSWNGRGNLPLLISVSYSLAGYTAPPEPIVVAPRMSTSP